jgi:hypothetical protein
VRIVLFDDTDKLVKDVGQLQRMTSVLENFASTKADLSLYVDAKEDIKFGSCSFAMTTVTFRIRYLISFFFT